MEVLSDRAAREDASAVAVSGLRVGWYDNDGWFPSAPAVRRAVAQAKEALRADGADLVPFAPPDVRQAMRLFLRLVARDGSHYLRAAAGESLDRRLTATLRIGRLSPRVRKALAAALTATGQATMGCRPDGARSAGGAEARGAAQPARRPRRRPPRGLASQGYRRPDLPTARASSPAAWPIAPTHPGRGRQLRDALQLTGHPAGVVPTTRVRYDEESDAPSAWTSSPAPPGTASAGSPGLPVGVQVVADHGREATALGVMRRLERLVGDDPDHPAATRRPVRW